MSRLVLRGRVWSALALLGLILAPARASAFCRTTTATLPPSYSPTRGCFTEGVVLFWKNACVGYSIQQDGLPSISFDDVTRVIETSFATWTSSTCADGTAPGIAPVNLGPVACASVRYNREAGNQNVIVFRIDAWPYNDANNTLGLTTVTFNADTGEIVDADMEINAAQRNLTTGDPVPQNGFDLQSVITHEAGHFYGLAHASTPTSTMYAAYKPGTASLRSLADDDVAGLCTIYPSTTERLAQTGLVGAGACEPTPRRGLASACDGSDATGAGSSSGGGGEGGGGGCAATGPLHAPAFGGAAVAGVALAALAVRRRRRR